MNRFVLFALVIPFLLDPQAFAVEPPPNCPSNCTPHERNIRGQAIDSRNMTDEAQEETAEKLTELQNALDNFWQALNWALDDGYPGANLFMLSGWEDIVEAHGDDFEIGGGYMDNADDAVNEGDGMGPGAARENKYEMSNNGYDDARNQFNAMKGDIGTDSTNLQNEYVHFLAGYVEWLSENED